MSGGTPTQVQPEVLEFMARRGGSFASHLAKAWLRADPANSAKLASTFGDLYDTYAQGCIAVREVSPA